MNHALVVDARNAMAKILGAELAEIVTAIASDPNKANDYFVPLPEVYTVDQDITELMALVARTSNSYLRLARLCGLAKAQVTIAEGAYKHKYKTNRVGSNEAERDKNGAIAAKEEWDTLQTVEAIYAMAEKLESMARLSSESARKILDKVQAMNIASHREERGDVGSVRPVSIY